jgi:hypothetical protein
MHYYLTLTQSDVSLTEIDDRRRERFSYFFESPEFDAIPYYDIICSLEAGFIAYKKDRKPKESDPYDFAALGSVLPYVDIVTTDATMKDMIVQLQLDQRYKTDVYSARHTDVLRLTKSLEALS